MAKGTVRKVVIERDIHDQLMIEMIKYFEASEIWELKKWDHKAIEARNALGAIRALAKSRRLEIQTIQKEVIRKRQAKRKGENNE